STATICSIEKRLRFMANHLLVQGQVCRKTRSRIGPGFLTQINRGRSPRLKWPEEIRQVTDKQGTEGVG
ncbi:hypothetical protein, partial [Burkholderia gladioli]|uniref:hypothetical protein n=1 Tax=Burkholderia gladioli TaxID=28095 RepID=UPI001ABB3A26